MKTIEDVVNLLKEEYDLMLVRSQEKKCYFAKPKALDKALFKVLMTHNQQLQKFINEEI